MSWYAVENIDKALEKSKEMLFPFNWKTWTKFAVIALLAGGIGMPNMPGGSFPANTGTQAGQATQFSSMTGMASEASAMVFSALGAVLTLALLSVIGLFLYLSSVFTFIFYQSVLEGEPRIVQGFKDNMGNGLRYLGFQIGWIILLFAMIALVVGGFTVHAVVGAIALLAFIPGVLAWVFLRAFVHDFVLLKMIESGESLVSSLKTVWPDFKKEWKQVGLFYLLKIFLGIVIGISKLMLMVALFLVLLVPFGILALIGSMIHSVVLGLVVVAGVICFFIGLVYLNVPFAVYMYSYITVNYQDIMS
ncbi:MAG: hypothetical protein ABEJ93_02880 [Candidatus Nanohalobium sp.]